MTWQNVLEFDENKPVKITLPKKERVSKSVQKKLSQRGCDFCPRNKVEGIKKVKNLDKVVGKKIMVWAQNPGREENTKGLELIGPAGEFLWKEGKAVGLLRENCDIQNVLRCWTATKSEIGLWEVEEPTKQELFCCSVYNEEAIERNKGKALVHLVLGKVAARQLLKKEFRKDQKTFWSETLKSWVVTTYHPSYFLRGAPRSKLREFREALYATVEKAKLAKRGKFAYIEERDYKSVASKDLERELETPIRQAASKGIRIVVDIEDDVDEKGRKVVVYIGFSWGRGKARGVFLEHPLVKQSEASKKKKLVVVKRILEDEKIRKALQHGSYDIDELQKQLGITLRGYDFDTQYAEYLRFSARRAFGLEAIADVRFREFAGYKEMLDTYRDEGGRPRFLKVPPKVLIQYNGADCDLTKRIEVDNKNKVNKALLKVLMYAAFPLAVMEASGPWFDWEYDKVLEKWIPVRLETLKKKLQGIAGQKEFNPGSPMQVAVLLYDKLKLGRYLDQEWRKDHYRSTDHDTMLLLQKFSQVPGMVTEYRKLGKKKGTYMDGYRKSAQINSGRLRTIWWLTGTVTGRLRSGGAKEKKKGVVNLQNIHGDATIENLLISDKRWREVYESWKKQELRGT